VRAIERTNGRRSRSRRGQRFTEDDWVLVEHLLSLDWSPEHISGRLALEGLLSISHETVYLYVWADKRAGAESWPTCGSGPRSAVSAAGATTRAEDSQVSATYPSGRPRSRRET